MSRFIALITCFLLAESSVAACEFEIEVGDSLTFSTDSIVAEANCQNVTITLSHTGSLPAVAMGHNWVLAKTDDYEAVAAAGMATGFDENFLPANDARVIAATKLIGGGETTRVSFSTEGLSADEKYTFFCSFPGHTSLMNGTFVLQ